MTKLQKKSPVSQNFVETANGIKKQLISARK